MRLYALLAAVAVSLPAFAKDAPQEITPVKATSNVGGETKKLIDGSGLSDEANVMVRTHKTMEKGGGYWNATQLPKGESYQDPTKKHKLPELVFDLGGTYRLQGLVLWNYSYAENNQVAQARAVARMSMWTADKADGPWKLVGITKVQDTKAVRDAVRAQAIAMPSKPTKFVKLILLENHGSASNFGFGEIRFIGTPADAEAKPEVKKDEKKEAKAPAKKADGK